MDHEIKQVFLPVCVFLGDFSVKTFEFYAKVQVAFRDSQDLEFANSLR